MTGVTGGNGGNGIFSSITNGYFGGGGGGHSPGAENAAIALGGIGGGGNGGNYYNLKNALDGTSGTGGGGGGAWGGTNGICGNGGSGIVLIRFRVFRGRGPTAFPFLYGSPTDGMQFPTTIMDTNTNYTLFHVARYYKPTGPPARLRIFDGVTSNWLSGFVSGQAGVAYHDAYLTATTDLHGNQWVLSTDQNNLYRSNGTDRTIAGYTNGTSRQLSINNGSSTTQRSDWAVAEVLVYDRQLTLSEYLSIEAYLAAKYFGLAAIPETGLISGALINAVFYSGAQGGGAGNAGGRGYPVSIARLGTRVGKSIGSVLRALDYRGQRPGALDNIKLSRDLPVAAYSLRQLFGEYTGPQVRVRRNTDNIEADIYMNSLGSIVSISGSVLKDLSTWLNGATAFVRTWYDQTNRAFHAERNDVNSQPIMVQKGQMYGIYFNGEDRRLITNANTGIIGNPNFTLINTQIIESFKANNAVWISFGSPSAGGGYHWMELSDSTQRVRNGFASVTHVPLYQILEPSPTSVSVFLNQRIGPAPTNWNLRCNGVQKTFTMERDVEVTNVNIIDGPLYIGGWIGNSIVNQGIHTQFEAILLPEVFVGSIDIEQNMISHYR